MNDHQPNKALSPCECGRNHILRSVNPQGQTIVVGACNPSPSQLNNLQKAEAVASVLSNVSTVINLKAQK
jgi:hypothetical protein